MQEEFQSRVWEEDRDLYLFTQAEVVVAGARIGRWNLDPPHRDPATSGRMRYYLVLGLGINEPFQGTADPGSGHSYVRSIIEWVEGKATSAECVGLSLWVRSANRHARDVYEHLGFEYVGDEFNDPDANEEPTFEMRKWL